MSQMQETEEATLDARAEASAAPLERVDVVDAIPLKIKVVLGSAVMSVRDVSGLRPGSLLTLDRKLGQPVDVTVNDRLICRGEIAVTDDAAPRFVIKIVELASGSTSGRSGK